MRHVPGRNVRDTDLVAVSPGVPLAEPAVRRRARCGTESRATSSCSRRRSQSVTRDHCGDGHQRQEHRDLARRRDGESPRGSTARSPETSGRRCWTHSCAARMQGATRACGFWSSPAPARDDHSLAADAAAVLNITEDHLTVTAASTTTPAPKARVFFGRRHPGAQRDDPRSLAWRCRPEERAPSAIDAPRRAEDGVCSSARRAVARARRKMRSLRCGK